MITITDLIIVVALFSAFSVILLNKFGITEWVQVNGNNFFSKMFNCSFCLCFWLGLICSIVLAVATGESICLLVPMLSTPLARILV